MKKLAKASLAVFFATITLNLYGALPSTDATFSCDGNSSCTELSEVTHVGLALFKSAWMGD